MGCQCWIGGEKTQCLLSIFLSMDPFFGGCQGFLRGFSTQDQRPDKVLMISTPVLDIQSVFFKTLHCAVLTTFVASLVRFQGFLGFSLRKNRNIHRKEQQMERP